MRTFSEHGFALTDIISQLGPLVNLVNLNADVKCHIMDKLADIEYRLAFGTSEKLQGAALVSIFQHVRAMMEEHKRRTAAASSAAAGGSGASKST